MSDKRFYLSLGYGIIGAGGFFLLTGDAMDAVYGPKFMHYGLGPYFIWTYVCILIGIVAFVLGLLGKLPGTK